jgi:hypothetical protein
MLTRRRRCKIISEAVRMCGDEYYIQMLIEVVYFTDI